MIAELSESFLYASGAAGLWKELDERFGQSNGPLIYQIERHLSKVTQAYYNKLKRCWDELQILNGIPTCSCGRMRECTCGVTEKFLAIESRSKLIQFLMRLNDEYESVRSQLLSMVPLPSLNKAYYIVQQVKKQKQVTQNDPSPTAFFANTKPYNNYKKVIQIGTKEKKGKKQVKVAANVSTEFGNYVPRDTPFHLESEVEYQSERVDLDQKLVNAVCQEMMRMFKGKSETDTASTSKPYAGISFHASIKDPSIKKVIVTGEGFNNLYICKPSNTIPSKNFVVLSSFVNSVISNKSQNVPVNTFHSRLGHSTVSKLIHVKDCDHANVSDFFCDTCLVAKSHRLPIYLSQSRADVPFLLIHVDLWGPYKIHALDGAHYFLTIIMGSFIKKSMVYTPQQNGRVERKHRHLLDTARALKLHANLPSKFWGDCILSATYLINKMPMKVLNWKTPFEMLHKRGPGYDHLRTIGCLCYANVPKPYQDKFEARGIRSVLIDYPPSQKGHKLYALDTKEVFCSRDVIFKEDIFPFKIQNQNTVITKVMPMPTFGDDRESV
ncbi:uncharacterized protein [Rutidosis leptorrhynchoides]|uniref:uncharacterized protein n=1 Tax=Rutidosis leptorrhynchoides TaxID=125765 RepID=UPI003A98DE46